MRRVCLRFSDQQYWVVITMLFAFVPLRAEDPPAPQQSATQQPPPATKAASTTPDDTTNGENWLQGFAEGGYQWNTGVHGNYNVYRSIVDLRSRPILLNTDFTLKEPSKRLFDRITVRSYNYGDQPYTTLHVSAVKDGAYDFEFDHRNIAYFNNLPEFANQYLAIGLLNSEQQYDIRKELNFLSLELFPTHFIVPYFGYDRTADNGGGVTSYLASTNAFTVPSLVRDGMNNYRTGVRFNALKWHATAELGGTTFKDDEQVYTFPGASPNYGNESRTAGGRPSYLGTLAEAYGIWNSSIYSRGNVTANLTDWLDLSGQFLFSRPETYVNLTALSSGNLALGAIAFTNYNQFIAAYANLPHTSASVGAEIFPRKRFRMSVNWLTDLEQENGNQALQSFYYRAQGVTPSPSAYTSELRNNYSEFDLNLFYDVSSALTIRGGYRLVYGNAWFYFNPADGLFPTGSGNLQQNIGIAGIAYHPNSKLRVNATIEAAPGDSAYFRTGLYTYQKASLQTNYQFTDAITGGINYNIVNNTYPVAGPHNTFWTQSISGFVHWIPANAKRFSVSGEYTRSLTRSNMFYLNPVNSAPIQSLYTDNANIATALVDVTLAKYAGNAARLSVGGALMAGYGSEPTKYYQPLAKLIVPLNRHVDWIANWTYYGYNQNFLTLEGFRTNILFGGIRLTR